MLLALPLAAQESLLPEPAGAGLRAEVASPPLPPEHWATEAAWRAEALGLLRGYLPAQRTVPRATVGAALREAVREAREQGSPLLPVTEGWLRRFVAEYPESARPAEPETRPVLLGSSVGLAYHGSSGVLSPATGIFQLRQPPRPVPDRSDVFAGGTFAAALPPHLSAVVQPEVGTGGSRVRRWDVSAALGPFALSAGDEPVGYGYGRGGGVVLSGVPLTRVEIQTLHALTPPGWLAVTGPVSFHTFLSRFHEARHPGDPWFWGMRLALQPHPRFTLAVNRAAIFGGDSVATPTTLSNFGKLFLGVQTRDFENQELSAEFRWRLPSERVLPATLYLEWGSEDEAGGYRDVPGTLLGLYLPALPSLPEVAVGAEWTRFRTFCCGNPPWYFHASFRGNWAAGNLPLGHPLGGEGWEALVYASADLPRERLRVDARAFRRDRSVTGYYTPQRAGNLYALPRAGRSLGGEMRASWHAFSRSVLEMSYYVDAGASWTEQRGALGASVFF